MPTIPPSDERSDARGRAGGVGPGLAGAASRKGQRPSRDLVSGLLQLSGWVFVALAVTTAVVLTLGSRLPARDVRITSAQIAASPDRVWQLLTELPQQRTWRTDASDLEPQADRNGLPCWTEMHGRLPVPLCVVAATPGRSWTVAVADPRLPFQGSWNFALRPVTPGTTLVTGTETSEIETPMWRFFVHFRRGERRSVDQVLMDLRAAAVVSPRTPSTGVPSPPAPNR